MRKVKFDMTALRKRVYQKHTEIKIGGTYFLSSFYDKEGATVKVLSTSRKQNRCGWNSSVNVEILDSNYHYYKIGGTHTVNATNLYENRHHASAEYKYRNVK
jgi:hypothetical protein